MQTYKPKARGEPIRAWFRRVEGRAVGQKGRQETEEQSQAVVATPRLLGTHHDLRALGAGLLLSPLLHTSLGHIFRDISKNLERIQDIGEKNPCGLCDLLHGDSK